MNLLDWVLIALFVIGALWGLRSGLIDAVFNAIAIYVALVLGAQFASRVLGVFTDSVENEALSKAIGYVIIFVGVFVVARVLAHFTRQVFRSLTVEWVDKAGGALLGIVAGLLLAGGLMAVLARYSYVIDESAEENGSFFDNAMQFARGYLEGGTRNRLDRSLVDSEIVGILMDIRNALPGGMLGMAPDDFSLALDILEARRESDRVQQA